MKRTAYAVLAGVLFAGGGGTQAQSNGQVPATSGASAETDAAAVTLPGGTAMNALLNSSLDSKKVKAGDKVEAHTTEEIKYAGKTIIPLGAKLEGRVTEATARSKGDSGSTLAIQFDKAITKKGEEIPLNVAIVAIAAPQGDSSRGLSESGSEPMAGAGAPTAAGSPMGTSHTPTASPGRPSYPADPASSSPSALTPLPPNSRGVYGIKDLKLMAAASNASQSTVITSSGKNVHLDSGTRLLLISQPEVPSASNK